MRIILLSDFSGVDDEGIRKIASHFSKELSRHHHVMHIIVSQLASPSTWRRVSSFNPDIIHFIPGVSLRSLALMKAMKTYLYRSRAVISALVPRIARIWDSIARILKPDLLLVQSLEMEKRFKGLGYNATFLPNGVDTSKFIPVDEHTKKRMREAHGLEKDTPYVLHVGPITKKRNLEIFNCLWEELGFRGIVIGSTSVTPDPNICRELKENNCIVISTYLRHIEHIYQLSDYYLFPVVSRAGSVEIPLSVLEAMACNLPVISTPFGALPRLFTSSDGLFFVPDEAKEEFIQALLTLSSRRETINTRNKVTRLAWETVTRKLERFYEKLKN